MSLTHFPIFVILFSGRICQLKKMNKNGLIKRVRMQNPNLPEKCSFKFKGKKFGIGCEGTCSTYDILTASGEILSSMHHCQNPLFEGS